MMLYSFSFSHVLDHLLAVTLRAKLGDSLFLVENGGLMIRSFNVLSAVKGSYGL